ncbi:MAG: hypothetical protein ACREUY_10705 [Burkholderiales bacterium]
MMPRKRFFWMLAIAGGIWLWSKRTPPVAVIPAATSDSSVAPSNAPTTQNMQALAFAGRDWTDYPIPVTHVGQ